MSVNKVILVGRLGNDPEVRHTPGGAVVANFNMATNEVWKDKQGERQERTEWHRIVVWGRQAELAERYLSKGRQVYLEGKLQTRQWEDQQGNKRYTTEVNAQTLQFLGSGASDSTSASGPSRDEGDNQAYSPMGGNAEPSFTDDDIPF